MSAIHMRENLISEHTEIIGEQYCVTKLSEILVLNPAYIRLQRECCDMQ